MNHGGRTVLVYLLLFCGVILAGLLLFAPVPAWLLPALVITGIVAGGGYLAFRHVRQVPPSAREEEPAPPPVVLGEQAVVQIPLPSSEEDYDFLFSATVRWSPLTRMSVSALAPLAVEAVLARATQVTKDRRPDRVALVQHELSVVLGRMRTDAQGLLEAKADSVSLSLPEADQERLDKLAGLRKDMALWDHTVSQERRRRDYLANDVLKDTGSAVVWWLSRNDDQVDRAVRDLGVLAQLAAAANNLEVSERYRHIAPYPAPGAPSRDGCAPPHEASPSDHFAAILDEIGLELGSPESALLARQFAEKIAANGRRDLADDLIRRFDVPEEPPFEPFDEDVPDAADRGESS